MYLMVLAVLVVLILASAIKILPEYERAVVFRLGRQLKETKGPGLFLLIPVVDKMVRVSLRLETRDVPPQDVITKDNVSIQVNAVIYFRVMDPNRAVVAVENYLFATIQFAQTTLRSVLGRVELDELLAERDKINQDLQEIIDKHTDPWGVKVSNVEIKHVDLPSEMRRAWAKQSEAERERRAKITHAAGEYQASVKLGEAAEVISRNPIALQLRYLQTLNDVAAENNSTIVFPIPIDLFKPFISIFEDPDKIKQLMQSVDKKDPKESESRESTET